MPASCLISLRGPKSLSACFVNDRKKASLQTFSGIFKRGGASSKHTLLLVALFLKTTVPPSSHSFAKERQKTDLSDLVPRHSGCLGIWHICSREAASWARSSQSNGLQHASTSFLCSFYQNAQNQNTGWLILVGFKQNPVAYISSQDPNV